MQFAFARSADLIGEDPDGFNSWFLDAFDLASQSIFDMQHNPWLRFAGNLMPRPVVRLLSKEVATLLGMREVRHREPFPAPAPKTLLTLQSVCRKLPAILPGKIRTSQSSGRFRQPPVTSRCS